MKILVVNRQNPVPDFRLATDADGEWSSRGRKSHVFNLSEGHTATTGVFENGLPKRGTLNIIVVRDGIVYVNGVAEEKRNNQLNKEVSVVSLRTLEKK